MKNSKGLTLIEMLVSSAILAILMLSLADYSASILDASDRHSQQLEKVRGARFSLERISEQVNNAAYIFPGDQTISFSIEYSEGTGYSFDTKTVNTSEAVALLVPMSGNNDSQTFMYNLVVFYIEENGSNNNLCELYEFSTGYPSIYWEENTVPSVNNASGTATKLTNDIEKDSDSLTYILNYDDSPTDKVLKGEIRGATTFDEDALIRGINWDFTIKKPGGSKDVELKGMSRNVPRYYYN
ncbi:MAG: prepilin-type N-terminal cleavage/methylation domain-containing protein [Cyanobacteriota bacterium]